MRVYLSFFLACFLSLTYGQKKVDEPTSYKDDLDFAWTNEKDTFKLIATSKSYAPIEIILTEKKSQKEVRSLLLQPFDSLVITQLQDSSLTAAGKKVNDSLKIGYYLGHPDMIDADLNYPYRLPFRKGKKYEVSQGFNGKTSHNSEASQYAIDFQLDVGESVYAARDGLVIKAIDWFTKQGGPELRNGANRILILHDDGTIASYVHLDFKGVFVEEGQTVEKGQKIGTSGLTGYTNGPHLHFVVRKERDIAIPVYFEGYEKQVLKQGRRYKVKK